MSRTPPPTPDPDPAPSRDPSRDPSGDSVDSVAPAPPLVLASASPRRRDLLAGLGLRFEVRPADVDESARPGETPEALVARLALHKARAVAAARPEALVLAADTLVVLDGEVLAKPRDDAENRTFVRRLAGRTHTVHTGHALLLGGRCETELRSTRVRFRPLDEREIERYVATGEGRDKAGGYAIQGFGAALVEGIDGCYFTVVGLSLAAVVTSARRLGVTLV